MLIDFIYEESFLAILLIFSIFYFSWYVLFRPKSKSIYSGINFAFPFSMLFWIGLNVAPIPPTVQQNLKDMLKNQASLGVGSNGLVNTVILGCNKNEGFLRGYDYSKALDSYKKDIINHTEGTEVFKLEPLPKIDINETKPICSYIENFNKLKFEKIL